MSQEITVLQLYPKDMNIYGDWGNVLAIQKRLKIHGFTANIVEYNPGDTFPENIDIIIGGGGQDSGQSKVQKDLVNIGSKLHKLADAGTPMLVICGLYQMFGHRFITEQGQEIKGISLFDIETKAGPKRLVGNIITQSDQFGKIVGYENHSGQTTLGEKTQPLARVLLGAGNNEKDGHEGAIYKNVIGSYLHGSLLPKNPQLTDFLIKQAALKRYGDFQPAKIDDSLVEKARQIAMQRPR